MQLLPMLKIPVAKSIPSCSGDDALAYFAEMQALTNPAKRKSA